MTNFPEQIASALMESIMAAFRTEAADLETLAKEVDAAGCYPWHLPHRDDSHLTAYQFGCQLG
jgi:hypothetical protein